MRNEVKVMFGRMDNLLVHYRAWGDVPASPALKKVETKLKGKTVFYKSTSSFLLFGNKRV